jgi:hypothetical protein
VRHGRKQGRLLRLADRYGQGAAAVLLVAVVLCPVIALVAVPAWLAVAFLLARAEGDVR